ncbi:AraC family transcriptional regulator [Xanthocytophaga agilis]|uniref:AraC family transcriptional regulator n=1 Tax=Xanthocytophaga agilis TaxID=3048010 RepID=A0AAE3REK4_9BACT|nr:AraC family transcriptional regulator [Xanthocytophaga agilis]MDJ1506678.1 AraC family transcriptional regulator [Xanthocytophaga agilis]
MKTYKQYELFKISRFETTEWKHPLHNHTYFEIIFIQNGNGWHTINDNRFPYKEGNVFLLTPGDYHTFEIETTTRFCYLKFTELYLKSNGFLPEQDEWFRQLEFILHTHNLLPGDVLRNEQDRILVTQLLEVLLHESDTRKMYSESIVQNCLKSMLDIIARNIIVKKEAVKQPDRDLLTELTTYVRRYIYEPEKLRIQHLAEQFNLSSNYIGIYFKRKMGESLQQYILQYKLKLIETRLLYSDRTISEIGYELGFTDESHLNKIFRKYKGMSPKAFRLQKRSV